MNKEDVMIMVVKKEKIFFDGENEGFIKNSEKDIEKRILENFEYMRRGDAEQNFEYKQPIPYAAVVNKNTKKVYTYKRNTKAGESRLHNRYSYGTGGHIDQEDHNDTNPISTGLIREVEEETGISGLSEPKVLGYINDNSDEVGKVHLGLFYILEVNDDNIRQEDVHEDGKFMSIQELRDLINDPNSIVENWSVIALDSLEQYLK